MEKKGFSNEEVASLNQLIDSLKESEKKLENYYKNNDNVNFSGMKNFMIQITEKIAEVVK